MKILNCSVAITEIISDKALKSFRKNQDLNIFTIEQVMDENGEHLLTWRQVQKLRGKSGKGVIPEWYKEIETEVLESKDQRKENGIRQIPI